jgi:3-keto-5-aminohexanoate cleavage enzyme
MVMHLDVQDQMAKAAKEAYDAGATIAHIHFRDQRPDMGHLPSWFEESILQRILW